MSEQYEIYEDCEGLCNYCAHPLEDGDVEYHPQCKISKLRQQRMRDDPR